jgi:NAD(P)H dehydrogenase (quinone)
VPPVHVFIVHAHPERRSLNSELKNVAVAALTEAGHEVEVTDLYAMKWRPEADGRDFPEHPADERLHYPIASRKAYRSGTQAAEIAVEQDKLRWADAVIFQFPLWWFGMPAILKGWVDRVYASGFAYGLSKPGGGRWGVRYGAGNLMGKRGMLAVTAGAPAPQYSGRGVHGAMEDLLFPITHGILYYPGMEVLPSFVVYEAARLDTAQFDTVADAYRQRLAALFTAEPIAFRPQDGGDYDEQLCLRSEIDGAATGLAIHRSRP